MPRKAEIAKSQTRPVGTRGARTAAVKAALEIHSNGSPKEIAELLQADGWDVKAQLVSVVKSNMKRRTTTKAVSAPVPEAEAAPVIPKDAISVALLQKAKKLVAQLGGIKEAKVAMDALAQILD